MKTKFILILLSPIIFCFSLHSQDWSRDIYQTGKKYIGYIVKSNGEKVEGYIEAQDRAAAGGMGNSNQNRVIFFSDPKNKKTKIIYKPEDLQGYLIADKYYKTMNYSGGLLGKPIRFVLQVKEGCLAKYVWYTWKATTPSGITWDEVNLIQKNDEKPFDASMIALRYADKMSELVSDHTGLANKVKTKEKGYGLMNMDEVMDEYNKWCAANKNNK